METPAVKAQRLLEEVLRQRINLADKVPDGYFDSIGWMKLWKMKRSQTEKNIKLLVKTNKMKAIRLKVCRGGKLSVVTFYG